MIFRDYQEKAIDSTFKMWETFDSTINVMPTGTGKGHLIAGIARRMSPARTMVLAHREELIAQAREKIEYVAGMDCDIEKAELMASTTFWNKARVVVASVQSLASGRERKRYERFNPEEFGCLIIDEGHHATAPTYQSIIKHFQQNPRLKLVGLTATPDRSDEEALGQVFKSVAFDYEILDAINDGWLVPVEQQMVRAEVDYSGIRTTAGDLNGADLAKVMEAERALQGVAGATIQIVGNRRTIVFASSVKHAESLCNILNRHKPGIAEWVCGKTKKEDRRLTLERFLHGNVQIVCNCGVLSEGYDNPWVECIVMGRPTKSRSLYAQMAGRSLRPLPGIVDRYTTAAGRRMGITLSPKPACLVIDFVGNSGKHKLMTTADILGGRVSEMAIAKANVKASKDGKPVRMAALLESEEERLKKEAERRRIEQESRRSKVVANVTYRFSNIDPFNAFDIAPSKNGKPDNGKVLSEQQRQLLAKQGIDSTRYTYADGIKLFVEVIKRMKSKKASLPQLNTLRTHCAAIDLKPENINPNITRVEASKLLDQIAAKKGWKRK